jgi:sirohydrochlorin ferrochelatase
MERFVTSLSFEDNMNLPFSSRRKRSSRGAATAEAVVVLPVFVVLFVGMFFVRDLTGAALAADQEARRCAWQYSANSCRDIPPGCEDVVQGTSRGSINPNMDQALTKMQDALKNGTDAEEAVARILESMVVDALAQVFSRSLDSKKTIEQVRPDLFGGGNTVTVGKYHLACNIPAQGKEDIATAAWKQFRP